MENLLEIKSLNTYYGESHILRDVDLNVKSGEMVCLIGRNGVGKTTLLKSLIGLLKQKKGDIYLIGENTVVVIDHDMEFIRRLDSNVSVLNQGTVLCEGTMETIQKDKKVIDVYLGRPED